jgi:hypothetical protein
MRFEDNWTFDLGKVNGRLCNFVNITMGSRSSTKNNPK